MGLLPLVRAKTRVPVWCGLASLVVVSAPASAEQQQRIADTSQTVVTLRAPSEGVVLVRSAAYTMGSDVGEIAFAMTSCRVEPARAACNVSEDDFAMEFPPHTVTLSDFSIDRNEVTVGDYRRCVEAGPCGATPLASGGKRFEEPSLPATMVTWNDAVAYCKWRGGRLPTEAEWERAARGLTQRRYPWGNTYDPYLTNGGRFGLDFFEEKDGFLELAPVGSIPSGKTPDGLLDMAGNVEEWVSDWYGPYPEQSVADPKGPDSGDEKVVRGGGYVHGRAWLRAASRGHDPPGARRSWRGFRCAFDP